MSDRHDENDSGTDWSRVGGGYGDDTVGQSDKTSEDVRRIELEKQKTNPEPSETRDRVDELETQDG
jgi:hypothetical protein